MDEHPIDPERMRPIRELGLRSAMIVPLIARERILGAITFFTAESGRRYGRKDLLFAQDLAQRAALAIDNARLYSKAQQELAERKSRVTSNPNSSPTSLMSSEHRLTQLLVTVRSCWMKHMVRWRRRKNRRW